jgi:catechol-2,3-dioxygenase
MHFKSLELFTTDVSSMVHFYRDVLACPVIEQANGFSHQAGTTTVQWRQDNAATHHYHIAFTIPWNKVAEAIEWTAAKTPLLEVAPNQYLADFSAWKAKAFYFQDPAGNLIEFIGREPLGLEDSKPFDGGSLASVSEMGIVTDDVPLACRQLTELWDVPVFTRQQPTTSFAAMGDDHGLFIVVQTERHWFPTKLPAVQAPLTALFETNNGLLRRLEIA